MNINKLLKGVKCECGKHHTCNIKYVYIKRGAISKLSKLCKNYKNVLLVADQNTYKAAGQQTLNALKGKKITEVIFSGEELLVPNEEAINSVCESLGNTEIIIGIGSGVIQDLCKYVSFYNNVPYMVVATAPSMDGYASNGAAMITNNMKVTYSAGLPTAIIGDVDVLKNAPIEMIKAGYGDIIGKFSALNDWKLSQLINQEYFCEYIFNLTFGQIESTLKLAKGILRRDAKSIKTLMEALVVIGIMMSFAGSSRPASGSEHHLSHFFEITGIIDNQKYLPHGIDVAYSTVITAKLREELLNLDFPTSIFRLTQEEYSKKMSDIYKFAADGCIELQNKVGNYQKDRGAIYKENESKIKEILSKCPSCEKIEKMLSLVDLETEEFYKTYSQAKIKDAILYGKDLKDRYTVLWLYYDLLGESENV